MALLYFKYLTNQGNTIIASQVGPFSLGANEAQLQTNYDIPVIQPVYLYKVTGSTIIPNDDATITAYLRSIGSSPDSVSSVLFNLYTGTTAPNQFAAKAAFNTFTGTTAPNTYVTKTSYNIYTGATQTALNNKLNTSLFNTYTGTTAPATYLAKVAFNAYTAATQTILNGKLNSSTFNTFTGVTAPATYQSKSSIVTLTGTTLPATYVNKTAYNAYTAATQTTLNGKLNTTDFNTYSANTISLIQSSQAGLDPKASVFVATTSNLAGATYNAAGGAGGKGQFTSAPTTIDGRSVTTAGRRILVKNQTDPKQNGIYVVVSSGVWDRASDMDGSPVSEVSAGNHTFVETGTTNTGSGWVVVGTGQLTLNTDPIIWTQFNAATAYLGGTGILITGMTISFNGSSVAGNGLTWSGTQLNVNPTGGTLGALFNTKADKSVFNTYTGTTAPNQFASKSNFNLYTGTTAPNTYQTKSSIVTLTGTTLPNTYQSKASIVILTGTTLPNTYQSKASIATYTGTTAPNQFAAKSAFLTYTATTAPAAFVGKTAYNAFTATTISAANNGLTESVNQTVRLGGTLTGATAIISPNTGSRLTFSGFPIQYATDVSANYNIRSIVDRGYVTGLTSSLVATANNGLTKVGQNVRLGGTFTGATVVNALTFAYTESGTTGQYNLLRTTGSINSKSRNAVTLVGVSTAGVDRTTLKISATGATFTDARTGTTASGIQYAADYSTSVTKRTLIDQGYFTGNTLYTSRQLLVYASGSTNISVTTPVSLVLNRLIRNDNTYYTYTGGTKIRILQAGTYDVSYQINVSNSNGILKSVGANLVKNGTPIAETTTSGTLGGQTSSAANLTLPATQLTFAANDIIQLTGFRLIVPLSGTADTTANGVFLSLVKKY